MQPADLAPQAHHPCPVGSACSAVPVGCCQLGHPLGLQSPRMTTATGSGADQDGCITRALREALNRLF